MTFVAQIANLLNWFILPFYVSNGCTKNERVVTVVQTSSLISMFFARTLTALVGVRNVFLISGILVTIAGMVAYGVFCGWARATQSK
ncbi:MAG: hypothetical protein AAF639_29890 [Chloroflexota bacterium]